MTSPINLKNLLPSEMEAWFESIGEKPFRARQIIRWLYTRHEEDFSRMTDLSRALRERLAREACLPAISLVTWQHSGDGVAEKFLFRLADGHSIESVLMHFDDHLGPGRATLCISTQVGCAMGCAFCASGQSGVTRNLEAWEIVDQVLQVQKLIDDRGERVANVVYMGIGEPLANYAQTLRSLRILNHAEGLQIGMRHIAVSTSGLVPAIRRLAQEKFPLRLAISLHAPDDALRSSLMPINRIHPLPELIEACRHYQEETGRRITFEYCLIRDVNDSEAHAHRTAQLLTGIHSLVNLIPLNPVKGFDGLRPLPGRVARFQEIIDSYGIKCTLRQEMGTDIDAACGQLREKAGLLTRGRSLVQDREAIDLTATGE